MRHNLYFFDHDNPEDNVDEGLSKSNDFEALFAVKLSRYLMLQNTFKDGEVAIITPYVGQLLKIKKYMSESQINVVLEEKDKELIEMISKPEDIIDDTSSPSKESNKKKNNKVGYISTKSLRESVRLATIDNFQGEEARIIILSLTRNNKEGKIGFLGIKNRANVLLSRAKEGMYILGNAESLKKNKRSEMWQQVLDLLHKDNLVGNSIQLQCERHKKNITEIRHWKDFDTYVTDGGCQETCSEQLPCGHICRRQCHADDPEHLTVKCTEKVTMILNCGHAHRNLYCYKATAKNVSCQEKIKIIPEYCPYDHEIETVCHRADVYKEDPTSCPVNITITMPMCSHEITVQCGQAENYLDDPSKCNAICGRINPNCGHKCEARCGKCILTDGSTFIIKHARCLLKCKKQLICGHFCSKTCHSGACPPCSERCQITCGHKPNGCRQLCSAPCYPCAEPCLWECEHQGKCILPCSAPCDRLPCDLRCNKILECGCQCPSLCGEPCPPKRFCLKHASQKIKDQEVDMLEFKKFRDLTENDVNKDPLIILACGHVFTTSTLDSMMKIEENYAKDSQNKWVSPLPPLPDFECMKTCPTCRTVIMNTRRYGRMINKAIVDKNERIFVLDFEKKYQELSQKLTDLNKEARKPQDIGINREFQYDNDFLFRKFSELAEMARTPPRFYLFQRTKAAILQLEYDKKLNEEETQFRIERTGVYRPDYTRQCRAKVGQAASNLLKLYFYYNVIINVGYRLQASGTCINNQVSIMKKFRNFKNVYKKAFKLTQSSLDYYEKTQCIKYSVDARVLNVDLCIQMYLIVSKLCLIFEAFKNRFNKFKEEIFDTGRENARIALVIANTEDQRNLIKKKIDNLEEAKKNANSNHLDILYTVLRNEGYGADFGRGHLYTCPNGHIYIIGDCGRAMEESQCPECGEIVGGMSHTLRTGNQVANHVIEELRQRMGGGGGGPMLI